MKVALDDAFTCGAYYSLTGAHLHYEVPKAQLERWEAATAAYAVMQAEIEQVAREQRERALTLCMEHRKAQASAVPPAIQEAYEAAITQMLQRAPLERKKEGE